MSIKPFCPLFAVMLMVCGISAGCSVDSVTNKITPYRIDVRQGNYIDQSMIAQLKRGMTPEQVRFVLGSPLIADPFHASRWDYAYRFQSGKGEVQQRIVSVFFTDGQLDYVSGDVTAASSEEEMQTSAPASKPRAIDIPAVSTESED